MIRSDLCIYNWLMPLILVLFERRNTIKKTNTIWNDNTVLFVNKSKKDFLSSKCECHFKVLITIKRILIAPTQQSISEHRIHQSQPQL